MFDPKSHRYLKTTVIISSIIMFILFYLFSTLLRDDKEQLIYVVSKTKSENSTFWHSVERGVRVATEELGLSLMFDGPEREIDIDDQIALMEKGLELEPTAIILAASDYEALADISQKIVDAGIPLVTLDSDVNISNPHSFIATDNYEASYFLGNKMAETLGKKGTVAIISHLEGTTSSTERMNGFIEAITAYTDIEIVVDIPYSNNDSQIAYQEAIRLLTVNPEIDGIFATNEATLIGVGLAIERLALKDQVTAMGFDISKETAIYLEDDIIKGIVIQRPFNMGYLSVLNAYNQAMKRGTTENISVDIMYVTKENMFDEETQRFIIPFLE